MLNKIKEIMQYCYRCFVETQKKELIDYNTLLCPTKNCGEQLRPDKPRCNKCEEINPMYSEFKSAWARKKLYLKICIPSFVLLIVSYIISLITKGTGEVISTFVILLSAIIFFVSGLALFINKKRIKSKYSQYIPFYKLKKIVNCIANIGLSASFLLFLIYFFQAGSQAFLQGTKTSNSLLHAIIHLNGLNFLNAMIIAGGLSLLLKAASR